MISIIIVSFNTRELTLGCLRAIEEARLQEPYEVIVVDNNSADGSADAIRRYFPAVKLLLNPDNKMYAIANNQGIARAKGDVFLLLNSDAILLPGTADRLAQFLRGHRQVAAVGPRIFDIKGELQSQGYPLAPFYWTVVRNLSLDTLPVPRILRRVLFPWTDRLTSAPRWVGSGGYPVPA